MRTPIINHLKPIYNYLDDLPCMEGQVTPLLPKQVNKKYAKLIAGFDTGHGCSFLCSFCTVINVQGRKSRFRTADDVEKMVRANTSQGIDQFFSLMITLHVIKTGSLYLTD